ncbi:MAG: tyrosine-type recombinase/integrase [Acidimicrobiales bacterium]
MLEPIIRDGASQIVKRAARAAGLVGDYASHSLRAGFVTDALDAGATREQVQRHGRWTNITSIDSYYRKSRPGGSTTPPSTSPSAMPAPGPLDDDGQHFSYTP